MSLSSTAYGQNGSVTDLTNSLSSIDTLVLPATVILSTGDTIVAISPQSEINLYKYLESNELLCDNTIEGMTQEIKALDELVKAKDEELLEAYSLKQELFTKIVITNNLLRKEELENSKNKTLNDILRDEAKKTKIKNTVFKVGGVTIAVGLSALLIWSLIK